MKAIGKREHDMHLKGQKLIASEAILAKCFDCMAEYEDGKSSCRIPECPLFPRMPYRENDETEIQSTP